MSCTYNYNGKRYSQNRLLSLLVSELPVLDQRESITWLTEKLGMNENEVKVVNGLIDGKSLRVALIKNGYAREYYGLAKCRLLPASQRYRQCL